MSDPYEIHRGTIPETYCDILEKQSYGHVATFNPNETIHNTPVWVDHDDGDAVLFNTLEGRRKEKNLRQNPSATISVSDPDNHYRYLSVQGDVSLSKNKAAAHIDKLARQYLEADKYPHHDEEEASRVIVRIAPNRVITRGRSANR